LKMKYQKEWPKLIERGKGLGLTRDQLYFLMALREVEAGSQGNEFNIKAVKGTNYDLQVTLAVKSIIANEKRWQNYIREQSYMDYVSYFIYFAGPQHLGWHSGTGKEATINQLKLTMKEIRNEFESNGATN